MFRVSIRAIFALAGVLLFSAASAVAQQPDPILDRDEASAATGRVSDALRSTLDALGASSGVPDGAGFSWYPRVPVRNQNASMQLRNYQFSLTSPVYSTDNDLVFADASTRVLDVQSNAILPNSRVPFPRSFWDIQAGGGYVHQFGDGWSWGVTLNLGTASDKPFNSLAEATLSTLAFIRKPASDQNAWLFYVVSVSNGQLGRNIPVPGVAYEYHSALLSAVVGFPFVTIDYRPTKHWQFEFNYGALTDVLARTTYHLTDNVRFFTDYEWTNQAWFRAERRRTAAQFFEYEMRAEGGFGWRVHQRVDFYATGGYAFNRFFVESKGFGFGGRNRVNLAPGPFVMAQFELKY